MTNNATFVSRTTEDTEKDYIAAANDAIRINGFIDPNSALYKNAIEQYNGGLSRGTLERLDVPDGFCGYIDPNTGQFRVEPEDETRIRSTTLYPNNITNPNDVPQLPVSAYPIDQCLAIGLPGSYEYTTGICGEEDGDNACSGIAWFSGGGTGSDAGTDILNQGVCGDGPGINSNIGVASSNPIAGASSNIPAKIKQAADKKAKSINDSAGDDGCPSYIANVQGDLLTYYFFYNIDVTEVEFNGNPIWAGYPVTFTQVFNPCKLKIIVLYNKAEDKIKSVYQG